MSKEDFFIEDFKLKLEYLQAQFSRLWQRLGFFLTVETALFGFYGWLAFEKNNDHLRMPCVLGLFITTIWYFVAAQDRSLVVQYRARVQSAAERLEKDVGISDYKGDHPGVAPTSDFTSLVCWYWPPISITSLPAWIAIALLLIWTGLLAFGRDLLT